ncbi:MAG: hypothetical protein IJB50_02210 [Clostridia bacterium]|nr:hypothetical protein [Clostridia bacterium]
MEFGEGQVFGLQKISQHLKSTQEKKELKIKKEEEISLFNQAKEEIKILKSTLDELCDKSTIESAIYRLKAAELDFNHQLSAKKPQPKD